MNVTVTGTDSAGSGINGAAVISQLNAGLTAAGVSGITANIDASNFLSFTAASTTPFSVSVAAATGGAASAPFAAAATSTNSNLHDSAVQTYAAGAVSKVVNDGAAVNLTATAIQNSSVSALVSSFNSQLIKAGSSIRAVVAANGTDYQFQSANNFTVGGVASNASTTVQGGFGASNTSALQAGNFLTGGSQSFLFNVAKADGSTSAVTVTLNGGTNGITSGNVIASLNAAIAAKAITNSELGTITASLDANNKLVFTGGAANTAFTVTAAGPVSTVSGSVPIAVAGAGSAENTADHVADYSYNLSSAPQSILLKDGTGSTGEINLTISGNSDINSAIKQINTALDAANSTSTAVLSPDGTAISFQNATNTLSVGGTASTSIANPTFAAGGTAADLSQSGAFLKSNATQAFTFNIANSVTGASSAVQLTLNGGPGGLTGAAAIAQLNTLLQTASLTAGQSDLGNIVASIDNSNHLVFSNASGTNPAYTVNVAAPSAGTGVFSGSVTAENTANALRDVAFTASTAITSAIVDSSGTTVTLNLNNTTDTANIATAIGKINTQLANGGSTVRAVLAANGTSISYQSAGAFTVAGSASNATSAFAFSSNSAALDKTGDFLQGGSQDVTFNVVGANGSVDSVKLTLIGGTGLTGSAVVASLQSLINASKAAHPGLANIVVGQDAITHKLTFTSAGVTNSAFTVSVAAPTAGTGVFSLAATASNTNLHTYAQAYASGALSYVINDGSATKLSLTAAQNTDVKTAIASLNQQLTAAGSSVQAVLAANGSDISFQSANAFRVGGVASNPTTTQPASISGNSVAVQAGPFLQGGTQNFTFNVVDPNSKSSTSYTVSIQGGTSGLTSSAAVLAAINNAIAAAVAGTPASGGTPAVAAAPGLAGIQASIDSTTGAITFSGNAGQAFTVSAGVASAGTGLTSNGTAVSSDNSALYAIDQTFTSPTVATALRFTSGTTTADVTISAGATIDQQITQTNVQLAAAGINNISAVKSGDGLSISYQSSAAFSIGTPADSGVFNGSTPGGTTTNAAVVPNPSATGLGNASAAINSINAAIKALGLVQGTIGSGENKLQYAINLAQSQISNFSAAESQIRDTDVAAQAANLTKSQVLTQTSIAAMAQANSEPQSVLKLLQ